jgi:hypothetical protein
MVLHWNGHDWPNETAPPSGMEPGAIVGTIS